MASSKSHRTDDTAELLKDIQNRIEKLERVVLPKAVRLPLREAQTVSAAQRVESGF
jgi:hypothetical protein